MWFRINAAQVAVALAFSCSAASAEPFTDPRANQSEAFAASSFTAQPRDPACFTDRLTATGGPAPQNPHTLAVRWTGFSNFELTYKGKIILLDAYFDRGREYPPLGFAAADVKKADAIIIGHGHYDHMSDAASVGIRTGVPLVGAALTTDVLKSEQVPESQIKTVTGKGGELLKFDGFTVQPILALHGQPDKHVVQTLEGAYNSLLPKPDAVAESEEKAIAARGTFDPRVVTEGTIAYLITLDDRIPDHVPRQRRPRHRLRKGRDRQDRQRRSRAGRFVGRYPERPDRAAGTGACPALQARRLHARPSRWRAAGPHAALARDRTGVPGAEGC